MANNFPHITIRVKSEDGPVPVDAFLTALRNLKKIASEVDRALHVEDKEHGWNITGLQMGSAVLTISPQTEDVREAAQRVDTIYKGMQAVQDGSSERPQNFSDAALTALKAIGAVSTHYDNKVNVFVENTVSAVAVNTQTVEHIDEWLGGKRDSTGSVEGKLLAISLHGKMKFSIYDKAGHQIHCSFPDTMLLDVKRALGERVCIRGKVTYRADGVPISVKATFLKEFPDSSKLPQVEDMVGIWKLGETGDQYIRRLRDG